MMKAEVSPTTTANEGAWERFKFHVIGWLYCFMTGNLWKYDVLRAQASLETGDFTSRLFFECRNAFGMTYPTPGATGESNGYAVFGSWWSCWRARVSWDQRHGVANTYDNLLSYMQAVKQAAYATDPQYVEKWSAHWNRMGWLTKLVNAPYDGTTLLGKLRYYLFVLLFLGVVVFIVYLWLTWRRKRKNTGKR